MCTTSERMSPARWSASRFASGLQAGNAGKRGRVFAEKSGSVLRIRADDATRSFAGSDALCGAPAGAWVGKRRDARPGARGDGGIQQRRLFFGDEAEGLVGGGAGEIGGEWCS